MRLFKWISAVIGTLLLAPANAFAFAVGVSFTNEVGDPTLPYVNEVLNITFSVTGSASGITGLYVDVIPDALFPSFGANNLGSMKVADPDPATPTDTEFERPPIAPGIQWRLFPEVDGETFSITDGGIVDIFFAEILAKASPAMPFSSVMGFNICTGNAAGALECAESAVPVNFVVRNGDNRVPEPTSLWLVLAALVAGAAVFRKGSNRS